MVDADSNANVLTANIFPEPRCARVPRARCVRVPRARCVRSGRKDEAAATCVGARALPVQRAVEPAGHQRAAQVTAPFAPSGLERITRITTSAELGVRHGAPSALLSIHHVREVVR